MVAPHPSIAWQMNKTPETIAFVTEAGVVYFTRNDFRGDERERLRQEIGLLVSGMESLVVETSVDDWLTKMRTPKQMRGDAETEWQTGKTQATIAFVHAAEMAISTRMDLDEHEWKLLFSTMERLKNGQESLGEIETVDQWLEQLRDRHP